MATVKVRALELGFDGQLRQPGDVFDIDEVHVVPEVTWFEVVDGAVPQGKGARRAAKNPALKGDEKVIGPDGKPVEADPLA